MPNERTYMTDSEWGRDMKVHRIIDAKLPLTWLLSSAAALVLSLVSLEWSVAAQNNKLEQLIAQYSKIEQRLDARDQRMDDLMRQFYEMQRLDDAQSMRIDTLERTVGINSTKRGK